MCTKYYHFACDIGKPSRLSVKARFREFSESVRSIHCGEFHSAVVTVNNEVGKIIVKFDILLC